MVLYLNVLVHHNLCLVGSDKDTMTGFAVKVALALDDTRVLATRQVQLDTDPFTRREGCLARTAHIAQVAIVLDSCADVYVHGLRSRVRHVWLYDDYFFFLVFSEWYVLGNDGWRMDEAREGITTMVYEKVV